MWFDDDLPRNVRVNTVLEHQALKCLADMQLVRGVGRAVHGTVAHGNDPGSLLAVHALQIILQPLVLLIRLGVLDAAVDSTEGTTVSDEGLRLLGVGLVAGEILGKGPLGAVGEVGFTVDGDEVGEAVVERVPEVADTAGLLTGHAETVLVSSEVSMHLSATSTKTVARCLLLPLGRRAAVISQSSLSSTAVGLVVIQVSSEDVAGAVELGTSSLVVTGQNHVGNLLGDITHPLLPQIPVRLIQDANITTLRATLVGNLALGEGLLVLVGDGTAAGQSTAGTVVANGPVIFTRQNTRVPVISIADITTVPSESSTLAGSLRQVLVSTVGIGVAHVVQDCHAELLGVTSLLGGLEAQDLGRSGAIGSRDLVVVGGARAKVVERDLVEKLTALGDGLDL